MRCKNLTHNQIGITLVEVILIMALFAIISGFTTINLLRPQNKTSVDTAITTLVSDLKQQQLKAMVGESGSGSSAVPHGIKIQTSPPGYILFKGTPFNEADEDNFTVLLENNLTIITTFSPNPEIIFGRLSGELNGFVNGANTITIQNINSGEQKIITINRFGSTTVN